MRRWTALGEQRRCSQPLNGSTVESLLDMYQITNVLTNESTPSLIKDKLQSVMHRFEDIIRLLMADVEQCIITVLSQDADACHAVETLLNSVQVPPNVPEPLQPFCLMAAAWLSQRVQ